MILFLAALALASPKPLVGDFDHDGRADRVEVTSKGDRVAVRVRRGADPAHPLVIFSRKDSAGSFYLSKAKPGRYRTACAKEYDVRDAGCAMKVVRIRGDVIDFGQAESSEAVALWNGRGFTVIWLSD